MSLDKAKSVFVDLLANEPADQWDARLAERAAGDDDLRRQVSRLLDAHRNAGNFLDVPANALGATIDLPATETAGTIVGPYRLIESIGEGGMGTVWMAQQIEPLKRVVAIKLIKAGMDTKQVLARFDAERQALALMDHPNIAKVLDGGATSAGRSYFVMELVKGIPITKYCDDHHLTPRQRLELFVPVCNAIQHAHQKGIIHRDLKPSNVLVALYDGRPVPKVIDFGVAKAAGQPLTEQTMVTGFGAIVGTLEYMSPEQAEINQLDIDTRSDIYSLGVLLYELLTGTTPLERKRVKESGMLEALRIIREEEAPTLSNRLGTTQDLPAIAANRGLEPAKLTKLVRGELDWIVMKALEKDRNRRYETTNGFAIDVQRYLADEPVQACPPSARYLLQKFVRRNRREVLIAGAFAAVAMTGVGGLAVSRALIARALRSETKAKEDLRVEVYFQRIAVAHHELSMDNLAAAWRVLQECQEDLRGWEWYYLMRLFKFEPLILQDSTEIHGVAFSPNGERIASAGKDRKIKLWDSRTGKPVLEIPDAHDKAACCVVFHPHGQHLASSGMDGWVKVWDLAARKEVFRCPCYAENPFGAAYTVAFRPSEGRQIAAGSDREVRIWDWKDPGKPILTFSGHEHHSIPVAFNHDGRQLVTGGAFRQGQRLWDAEAEGDPLRTFPAHGHPTSAVAISPDGKLLASASFDQTVRLWEMNSSTCRTLSHTGKVLGLSFHPDGQLLASAGDDKSVRIWDTTGREVLSLRGHTDQCGCVCFSPDGSRLVSASADGTIRIWDAAPPRPNEGQDILTFTGHGSEVRSVAFSPDGQTIATAGRGPWVKVWKPTNGRLSVPIFRAHEVTTFCLAWQPEGQRIATAGADLPLHIVKVWDARTGRNVFAIDREDQLGAYHAVAFSPDGHYLVTGKTNGAVQVWDGLTGKLVDTLGTHDREIRAVIFSRDRKHLASASGDGCVKLWDASRLTERPPVRHTLPVRVPGASVNIAFSPDSKRLATGGEDNTILIWDVEKGEQLLPPLRGHSKEVYAVVFSPDVEGRWVASGGEDGKVKIWDSHFGKLLRTFRGHTDLINSVAFSSDGRLLVSGSRDHTVKVWDVSKLEEGPNR